MKKKKTERELLVQLATQAQNALIAFDAGERSVSADALDEVLELVNDLLDEEFAS